MKLNGGVIGEDNPPTVSGASGVWGLFEAKKYQKLNVWPMLVTPIHATPFRYVKVLIEGGPGGVINNGELTISSLEVKAGSVNRAINTESTYRYVRVLIEGSSNAYSNNGIISVSELGLWTGSGGTGTNRAAGKTVTAASSYPSHGPALVVDGNTGTYYATSAESGYAYPLSGQWLKVDLGGYYGDIASISLSTYHGGGFVAVTDFTVQHSYDGVTWSTYVGGVVRGASDVTRTDILSVVAFNSGAVIATAASIYPNKYVESAIDGNTGTYYATSAESGYAYPVSGQWLKVDLGAAYSDITTIALSTYEGFGYGAITDYTLQYSSDDITYTRFFGEGAIVRSAAQATRTDTYTVY